MELLAESAEGVGYLLKDRVSDVNEFADAVRAVSARGARRSTRRSSRSWSAGGGGTIRSTSSRRVSARGPRLMAEGRSNSGIAEQLVVTDRAVEKHVTSIFSKLRCPLHRKTSPRARVLAYLRS
jgi:DNA-binding NarL/FixJ family response regulator